MRTSIVCVLVACGGRAAPPRAPAAVPADFCPALLREDVQTASAAASARLKPELAGPGALDTTIAWLREQPCVGELIVRPCSERHPHVFFAVPATRGRGYIASISPEGFAAFPTPTDPIHCMAHQDE